MEKKLIQWAFNILMMILFAVCGYVFNSVTDRISKVEQRVDALNPTFVQIQTDLSEIKTNIEWIKQKVK